MRTKGRMFYTIDFLLSLSLLLSYYCYIDYYGYFSALTLLDG